MTAGMQRLLGNIGRAVIAGGVPALMMIQADEVSAEGALTLFGLYALLWLGGAYEVDIRQNMGRRPRNG